MAKRNPNDSTERNVKAANRKIAALTLRVRRLERALHASIRAFRRS